MSKLIRYRLRLKVTLSCNIRVFEHKVTLADIAVVRGVGCDIEVNDDDDDDDDNTRALALAWVLS